MKYDIQSYFKEIADNEVTGFTIIERRNGQYRLAEKWSRPDGDAIWQTYWIPESQLVDRTEAGLCERVGELTEEQFQQVCQETDERALVEA